MSPEFPVKIAALRARLAERGRPAVLLGSRAGFSWLTGGGHSHVNHAVEPGVALLVVTPDQVTLLTNVIEAPRLRDEEVSDLPVPIRSVPWHEPAERTRLLAELIGPATAAPLADCHLPGLPAEVDPGLAALRRVLQPVEAARIRECGRRLGAVLGEVARRVEPGWTEFRAAGELHRGLLEAELLPWVTLVAADERIALYRHPIPSRGRHIRGRVMLVACAEYEGLICACTRIVGFARPDADFRRRHEAVARVDAALIHGTRPGRKLGDTLADGIAAYAAAGFPDEWKLHHQGGPCGYAPREFIVNPATDAVAVAGMALAWNPSIAGTKSEDTILLGDNGPEVITPTPDWPVIAVAPPAGGPVMHRPDVLVR